MVKRKFFMKKRLNRNNVVDWVIIACIGLLVLITIIPFMNILAISFSNNKAVLESKNMLFPKNFTFVSYIALFTSPAIFNSFLMTIAITVTYLLIHMTVTILAGFVLSRKTLPLRRSLMIFVLITILFNGGLVPTYLVVSKLGLIDKFWVLVLPGVVSGYSVFLMKNFIMQIPSSLEDAAAIDGAGPLIMVTKIIVPLSMPIIATLALFGGVGKWNEWFSAYIYIKSAHHLRPIQNVLQTIVISPDSGSIGPGVNLSDFSESFQKALIIFSMLPVIIAYPFAQKYFIKGIFLGSVKE